ncbi:hypothetical protein OY671_011605, partial [Metschnikowia pulcherrima]
KVFPSNVSPTDDHATVRTEVKRDNGDRIAVNYESRKEPTGWKAYDVNIDGISYVKSYREDFGAQIDQKGIESHQEDHGQDIVRDEAVAPVESTESAPGNFTARGPSTFATARIARAKGLAILSAAGSKTIQVDCSGITASD